ncbi:hypothetical protein ACF06W_20490 [Streptomyces albus]|uniref:hypothetical protein n=1 Tax=Streptomyces albus TaxID=1888 RepID=UPI0036FB556C
MPAITRTDGERQPAHVVNPQRWNELDASGTPQPHPIDAALAALHHVAMHG